MMRKFSTSELIAQKGDLQKLNNKPRNGVYLLLDNIRSVYNVGAIFRTADAARVEKIYLGGITAHPPRKDIEKTALKTVNYVPWEYCKDLHQKVLDLKKNKIFIVALEQTDKSCDYDHFFYKKPIAIIVGNEVCGVSDKILKLCDASVSIPMNGIANSLNVATATGIILLKSIEK